MAFTVGKEYICQNISSEPIRIHILQREPLNYDNLYKITSTNLFNSNYVQVCHPFMFFSLHLERYGSLGLNEILARWEKREQSLIDKFNSKIECVNFCMRVGTRSNWQEVEESAQSALKQCEASTRPNSPHRKSFTLNNNIRF